MVCCSVDMIVSACSLDSGFVVFLSYGSRTLSTGSRWWNRVGRPGMTSVRLSTIDSALRCSIISYRLAYRYRWSKSSSTPNWYACFRYGSGSIRATQAVRSTATCS
ncbi:hypothetical protein SFUMM280S_08816 [Streptomyces fumanus]